MLKVTVTINGQQIDINDTAAIDKAMMSAGVDRAIKVVKSKLTEEEQGKITINVIGSSTKDLALNVKGPDVILAKLKTAISEMKK